MGGEFAPSARPASGSRGWTGAPSWSRVRRWVSAPVVDARTTGAAEGRGTDGLLRHWRRPCAMTVAWGTDAGGVPTVAWGTSVGQGRWRWLGPGHGLGTGMGRGPAVLSGHRRGPCAMTVVWGPNGGRSHWRGVRPHAGRPLTLAERLEQPCPGKRLASPRTRAFVVSLPWFCAWGLTLGLRRRR